MVSLVAYVVGGDTEYLSTIRRFLKMRKLGVGVCNEMAHTDTRGSPSTGTRNAASAREYVLRPPGSGDHQTVNLVATHGAETTDRR